MSDNRSHNNQLAQTEVMSNWMYADPVQNGFSRPNLKLKILGNVPRFVLKTGVPGDTNNGNIDFKLDAATFFSIIACAQRLLDDPNSEGFSWTSENDFIAGRKMDKFMVESKLTLARDPETKRPFISILGHNRPKIQMFFGPSKFHNLFTAGGKELGSQRVSEIYLEGQIRVWSMLASTLLHSKFDDNAKNVAKPPSMQGGGGGQGGGQRQGGGGGSYQQRQGGGNNNGGNSGGGQGGFDDDFGADVAF